MSHTQCDSPGDSRVLSQLGFAITPVLVLVCFNTGKTWILHPWPLQCADTGSRAGLQGDALWRAGAPRPALHRVGFHQPLGRVKETFQNQKPNSNSTEKLLGRTGLIPGHETVSSVTRVVHNPPSLNCHLGNLKVKIFFSYLYYLISCLWHFLRIF